MASKIISPKVVACVCAFAFSFPTIANAQREAPDNLRSFYDSVKGTACSNVVKSGFQDGHGNEGFSYCRTKGSNPVIYLKGPKSMPLGDMDIDCDGANDSAGKCSFGDGSSQDETAFMDTVKTYGIPDLDAHIHSYVVFGNEGASPTFNPQDHGVEPLGVMAVVCPSGNNYTVFYAVWGDTNGGTYTGEASIALAEHCFPDRNISGNNGHGGHDVLYRAFPGSHAVPGKNAKWNAKSFEEFEPSLADIGDSLVAQLPSTY